MSDSTLGRTTRTCVITKLLHAFVISCLSGLLGVWPLPVFAKCWIVSGIGPSPLLPNPPTIVTPTADAALEQGLQWVTSVMLGKTCEYWWLGSFSIKSTVASYTYWDTVSLGPTGPTWYMRNISFFDPSGQFCSIAPLGLSVTAALSDTFPSNPALCGAPPPIIKLSNDLGLPAVDTLADVAPSQAATNLRARVYTENGQLMPNTDIKLEVTVVPSSGGHQHHDGNRPKGLLSHGFNAGPVITGNTGIDGMGFTFSAPVVAGDHTIAAACIGKSCKQEGPKEVWVGHKGLQPLSASAVYRLIPNQNKDPGHPSNHYLTLLAASRMAVLAALYQAQYPNKAVLHLNDASLERGGFFDLNHNWQGPHYQHCRGTVIDIRANGAEGALDITSKTDPMIKAIKKLAMEKVGIDAVWEVPVDKDGNDLWQLRHFHTKLIGQEGLQCP